MTSWYDYQFEIKTSKPNEVQQALIKEGWFDQRTDSSYDKGTGVLEANGEGSFHTGATEETHKEICEVVKKVDPDAKVVTRWHFADDWDWDDEYGSLEWDPNSPCFQCTGNDVSCEGCPCRNCPGVNCANCKKRNLANPFTGKA